MVKKQQKLSLIRLDKIGILDGFWKDRLDVFRKITIPDVIEKFEKDRGGALNNFKRIRDGKLGYHAGPPWFDGLIGECIRGISDFLALHYDKDIDALLDAYIKLIAEAQDVSGDGYLNTYTSLMCPEHRLGRDGGNLLWQHDLYNSGCIVEAGVHHYLSTGKTTLLEIACKLANYMVKEIGPEPRDNIVPAHALPEEAFLKLYCLFTDQPEIKNQLKVKVNEEDYLNLVKFWLDMRGHHKNRKSYPRYMGEYSQDHMPLAEQYEAVGHAVRAALLYTGLAEYVNITGDEKYAAASHRIWENITRRKMHISGNIGAIHMEEKFGYEYQLPNDAYLETCAGAAMLFFSRAMYVRDGQSEYMDVLERVLYNGVLPGVSLNGNEYFYENPLSSKGDIRRWSWHTCPCCPPMFLKVMGELPSYIYATDGNIVYANLYISSGASIPLKAGIIEIQQKTSFPWASDINLTIKSSPQGKHKIQMRIPSWAGHKEVYLNGSFVETQFRDGYAILDREWKAGDCINLSLEVKPILMATHPYVKDNTGKAAIQYGPLLYCVEETGNDMEMLVIPENFVPEVKPSEDFPGMMEIHFEDTLYRKVKAIPYFAWANRKIGKMEVWLPVENFREQSAKEWGEELYKPYKA